MSSLFAPGELEDFRSYLASARAALPRAVFVQEEPNLPDWVWSEVSP